MIELAVILALITQYPQIYEGNIKNRPAIVHYSGKHFYVVYIQKHAWGANVEEIVQVDKDDFIEERLYVSEQVLT